MNEHNREQISALMDGELDHGPAPVLNALSDHAECRQTWQRYHLIGESLRGNLPGHIDMGLADRISAAIQNEPSILAPRTLTHPVLRPVIGFAIAASVTAIAILGVRQSGFAPAGMSETPVAANPSITAPQPQVAAFTDESQAEVPDYRTVAEAEARLNRYLVNYNEYRTNAGVQGMLPYVRIVAHEVVE